MSGTVRKIEEKIMLAGKEAGYPVSWLRSETDMDAACQAGLVRLYQEVFAAPPYNECFTESEVREAFASTIRSGGFVFVACEEEAGAPVAFVCSVPLAAEDSVTRAVGGRVEGGRAAYFSEDATRADKRRQGISTAMKKLLLSANFLAGMESVVMRTMATNYRQLSAAYKVGGVPLEGVYQDVEQQRVDGGVGVDRRVFCLFEARDWCGGAAVQSLPDVAVARPGGNDTALILNDVARGQQGALSLRVQKAYPGVEQTMFLEKGRLSGLPRGQMAGGEFCGNATRSLGYVLLEGKDGEMQLEISGASKPLLVRLRGGRSCTDVPVLQSADCVRPLADGEGWRVDMEGISFYIAPKGSAVAQKIDGLESEALRKEAALEVLAGCGLTQFPASGLLLVGQVGGDLTLDPYVYVRDTGTMYFETGCGSGSTAAGLMLAAQSGGGLAAQKIVQPSGMALYVSVEREGEAFARASVDGPVDVLFKGRMYLPRMTIG